MEVVDKHPVKAVVIIVGESSVVVFKARDETARILSEECEEEGFTSVCGSVAVDVWFAKSPTVQLSYEQLKRIEHRLRKSGHEVLDIVVGDSARETRNSLKGVLPGHGILDVLCEDADTCSGSEHDGGDSIVMDELSEGESSFDVASDDVDRV